jgi:hypothetical protein
MDENYLEELIDLADDARSLELLALVAGEGAGTVYPYTVSNFDDVRSLFISTHDKFVELQEKALRKQLDVKLNTRIHMD